MGKAPPSLPVCGSIKGPAPLTGPQELVTTVREPHRWPREPEHLSEAGEGEGGEEGPFLRGAAGGTQQMFLLPAPTPVLRREEEEDTGMITVRNSGRQRRG